MNTMQTINDIKQKLTESSDNPSPSLEDTDFLTVKFSRLEVISKQEGFDFSFENVNRVLEQCYITNELSRHIFTLRKEILSLETIFSTSELFEREINAQAQEMQQINSNTHKNSIREILNGLKVFLPILKNHNKSLAEQIQSAIGNAENFTNTYEINDENIEKLKTKTKDIKQSIQNYFTENPTAKKVALGAGALGLGALGFIVGREIYKSFRQPKHISNDTSLIIAYYLSRFDHDNLFDDYIPANQAISAIADVLEVKPNTLRNMRDYFDSIIEEKRTQRKGYSGTKIPSRYHDLQHKYKNKTEGAMREKVILILNERKVN